MNKNTLVLLYLSLSSVAGGMAFKDTFDYSMIIGIGLAIVCLVSAGYFLGKRKKDS